LMISIHHSLQEMRLIAERQANLEILNQNIEQTHRQLLESSRQAGMAEVATSVLHNVGNVLTSVNVTASLIVERVRASELNHVANVAALLQAGEKNGLAGFFAGDPKYRQLPAFVARLGDRLTAEQRDTLKDLATLTDHIDHIKDIVAMQQTYA